MPEMTVDEIWQYREMLVRRVQQGEITLKQAQRMAAKYAPLPKPKCPARDGAHC
jgi:hypothetical protein